MKLLAAGAATLLTLACSDRPPDRARAANPDRPYGAVFDSSRFEIVADQLTLRYLSYPFYAPVATTLEFTRMMDSTSR